MKALYSVFVLFLFALCASAQFLSNQSVKPDVTIIQQKWRMEAYNPALDKDLLETVNKREEEDRRRREIEKQNEIRTQRGMPNVVPPMRAPSTETGKRGISVQYIYEVKVRNTGEKEIHALTWEYVFFEPDTKLEAGRRQFVSKVSINPGKTRNLVMRSTSPPTDTIDAAKAGKKLRDQYLEQVVIRSIEYSDGSVWQATSK